MSRLDELWSLAFESNDTTDAGLRQREAAFLDIARQLADAKDVENFTRAASAARPLMAALPKARAAKTVRLLIEMPTGAPDLQESLCLETIEWSKREKRTFLRHRVESRLAQLYLETDKPSKGLEVVSNVLGEIKKLDDKGLLVELYLMEAKMFFAVRNIVRAKTSLTAASTNANAIHCPPLVQAEIDRTSGLLHAEEKDFQTAYSYFFEAFEAFEQGNDPRATACLKAMVLCRVMSERLDDADSLLSGKQAIKFSGRDMTAIRDIAAARKERSLKMFECALQTHKEEFERDLMIKRHISDLYESLLSQNLLRILEAYSRIEISHIAKLLELPSPIILKKIVAMILDGDLKGSVDEECGVLTVVGDTPQMDEVCRGALGTIQSMAKVADALGDKILLIAS